MRVVRRNNGVLMTTRSGYAVTIRGFIQVVPSDLALHGEVLAEITEAKKIADEEGDILAPDPRPSADAMLRRMEIEQFDVKPVTRRAKGEGEAS